MPETPEQWLPSASDQEDDTAEAIRRDLEAEPSMEAVAEERARILRRLKPEIMLLRIPGQRPDRAEIECVAWSALCEVVAGED
jgi:hypothetical protein